MLNFFSGTALRKLEETQKKIAKLQGQILRIEQQLDAREQFIYFNRLDSGSKVRHLKRTIQVPALSYTLMIGNTIMHASIYKYTHLCKEMQQNRCVLVESRRYDINSPAQYLCQSKNVLQAPCCNCRRIKLI